MNTTNINLEELKIKYDEAVYSYYQTDNSIMSDIEFDELKDILESNGYELSTILDVESVNTKQKLADSNNMISLKKVQVFSDSMETTHVDHIVKWLYQYDNAVNMNTLVCVGWKLDGCAISLRYDAQGNIYDVVTRGNFSIANKMLDVARKYHPTNNPNTEIRCEAVMNKNIFLDKYANDYANPRNLVSGILNDFNIDDHRKYDVEFIKINDGINATFDAMNDHVLDYKISAIADLPEFYNEFKNSRDEYAYPTDGLVVYLRHVHEFKSIGKYPLHSLAIKFAPTEVITIVNDISWQLKKSGEWIPKAILEPIELCGTTVTKTLIFNYGYMTDNKIYPGAKIVIAKNGDIIPYIQRVIEPGDISKLQLPEDTYISGKHLYPNGSTEHIARERFIAGCYVLGIKHFGYAWFSGLADLCNNKITNLFDKTIVNIDSLKTIFGGDKKIRALINELYSINSINHITFLLMLQIPRLGISGATQVARYRSFIKYDFTGLEKQLVESCINGGEYNEYIVESQKELSFHGLSITNIVDDTNECEATFEMTGSPKVFGFKTKKEFTDLVKNWQHTKLDKTTSYLITDDPTSRSSKMQKAIKLGVTILTYDEAIELHNKNK